MKVGDKYICKKNRFYADTFECGYINIIGLEYSITEILGNIISVTCEKNLYYIDSHYTILGDSVSRYIFDDYFLSEKEIRKIKLKKLKKLDKIFVYRNIKTKEYYTGYGDSTFEHARTFDKYNWLVSIGVPKYTRVVYVKEGRKIKLNKINGKN